MLRFLGYTLTWALLSVPSLNPLQKHVILTYFLGNFNNFLKKINRI
jgi:hypothetical protein